MTTKETIHSTLAIPPGEYLEEVIAELGMTKEDLARRMGRPATKLSPIFKGEKAITPETALQLERVVGVPAHIWTGLEAEYRLTLARNSEAEREQQQKQEGGLVGRFCYKELAQLGEVLDTRKPLERVRSLQAYFGVTSLHQVLASNRYQAAFRCGAKGERSEHALAAWLRLGERRSQKMTCRAYDESRLRDSLDTLKALTQLEPKAFEERLAEELAGCGVALVICPHFPKTRAHGATFWLSREKAVLMLTIRGKWADIFWFSLFHEIGHILLHGKQTVILEDGESNERENAADRFASSLLIDENAYLEFRAKRDFCPTSVKRFALTQEVHPGIVVGRLQHDRLIEHSQLNDLRARYELAD